LKHRRKNIGSPRKRFHFALISDQRYRLMAHFNSGIDHMKANTSGRPGNEYFHDKPSDKSDLFSIRSEYQLTLMSVMGLK